MMQPKTNETLLDPHHKPAKNEILDRLNDMAQILLMASAVKSLAEACMWFLPAVKPTGLQEHLNLSSVVRRHFIIRGFVPQARA